MVYNELKKKIQEQININEIIFKQTKIIVFPAMHELTKKCNIEMKVQYGINEVFNDFLFKEKQIIFFMDKYLTTYYEILKRIDEFKSNDCFIAPNQLNEEMVFYFDSLIAAISIIIESQQKDELNKYLTGISESYPSRQQFGLWWQIYMLRNRILHTTSPRYTNDTNYCTRYINFSSKVLSIKISDHNIIMSCTLLDIYKDENIKLAIEKAINDASINPFDLLFENTSAKGYGKKRPNIAHISNDVYFDYASSGIKLIDDIQELMDKINHKFLLRFSKDFDNIDKMLEIKTTINGENWYSVKEVFPNLTY